MIRRAERLIASFAALLCAMTCVPALAHKPSDSYLKLDIHGTTIDGQWDIALRDLDFALGLDADGDAAITWGELRLRHDEIAAYTLAHLSIRAGAATCTTQTREHLVDNHTDGAYAVVRFRATCPQRSPQVQATYTLFFDLDPQHRGLLNATSEGRTYTAVLSPQRNTWQLDAAGSASGRDPVAGGFFIEGIWHIWIGADHLLFLMSLLLPAVLVLDGKRWRGASRWRGVAIDVLKIVTAFTVAHSITLSLAALGVITVPSRLVESVIAGSVVLAALNNLFPVVSGRLWLVAFAFGLVHGIGFANVLADLGLPRDGMLWSLLAFNLGVEAGQLVIVGLFLPVAWALRESWFYRVVMLRAGSALIAMLACIWLAERGVGISVF